LFADLTTWSWASDGWVLLAGVLCAVSASLVGVFVVLRRMSMLGDAISHAVLPGLAAAFFLTGQRSSLPMFVGAVVVGVLTAVFTEWVRGFGRVDEGASMGVVFTSLFALGLVMVVQAADRVDLDPDCVLYGEIEYIDLDRWFVGSAIAPAGAPRVVVVLAATLLLNLAFVIAFYKELKIASFDPALATTSGLSARVIHYALVTLVAVTAVACFESVGNILVVAMLVVPPATAALLTDRLGRMVGLSVLIAALAAVGGHFAADTVPRWFGFAGASMAGMMATVSGLIFLVVMLLAPRYGVISRLIRLRALSWQILTEDVVAFLYRWEERRPRSPAAASSQRIADAIMAGRLATCAAAWALARRGLLAACPTGYLLTDRGREKARGIVRSHRLWETYLVREGGATPDAIHPTAEALEHYTTQDLRARLDREAAAPTVDPHGSAIPPENDS